ncbi:hypothetical protein FHW79_005391 [Azospirillum sp. OGB3]|uniref:hypothetical protein n=1 Tax=Azospirillum sp. OGB3 TaxID=2587012 RepID=UPI00160678ED|nr:hypothetical protein [Azospirillum sp. OGB3]MBB3267726.1 hypothetical protein [Azospirillum sp. OGB3]
MSILSFPDRGSWGKAAWRGNCSGYVYLDLFQRLRPKAFVDPMSGSGTSIEVAREMGIEAYGLDLHSGFNAVRHSILQAVGKPADLVLSHPPYGSMIVYSGNVWGDAPHPDDLSRCSSDDEFHEKMQLVLLNQRDATAPGGYYGTIIGDWRRRGMYTSYQAEMIARMPRDELAAVLIKQQHNCQSDAKAYGRMALPFILHEYILLWQKKASSILVLLSNLAHQQYARLSGTWKNVVKAVLMQLGGQAPLSRLYEAVAQAAPDKLSKNPHWQAKVRQTLNQNRELFTQIAVGEWAIA